MSDSSLIFNILAVDRASSVIGKLGGNWTKLALGVAAAAGAIAIKTTMMAANFQSQMTRLVTSAGETHAGLKVVSNGVLDLAGQVGYSTSDLSKALYTVESAGGHGAKGLAILKAAAQGAKAENADLETVADAVTSALADYGKHAGTAAVVTSKLVAATGSGKMTMEQLAGSLASVLPVASSAKVKFDDILASIAGMTVHGMSADQATQNLADTIRHMEAPTLAQTKALAQMGIKSGDLAGMLGTKGLTGTLEYLSKTILSHSGKDGQILLGTFNKSAQAAANVKTMVASMPGPMKALANQFMANKINSQDWGSALRGLTPEQANQMRQFATLQNRTTAFSDALKSGSPTAQAYAGALRAATGDATGMNVALMLTGENMENNVTPALKAIKGATADAKGNVKGWADVQKTFNQRMAETKGTIEAVSIRIGLALLPYAQKALIVIQALVTWFSKHTTAAKLLGGAIGILAAGMLLYKTYTLGAAAVTKIGEAAQLAYKGVTLAVGAATKVAAAGQWLLNAAMTANPIGLVIAGIVLLVAAFVILWTHSAAFRKFWIAIWHGIREAALAVAHWFAGPFVGFFTAGWHGVEKGVTSAYKWVTGKLDDLVGWVKKVPHRISSATSGMWDGIKNAFRSAINWIIRAWNSLHFSIPSIDTHIPGIGKVGGFSMGVPRMPQLAAGGTIAKGGLALVGEKGPEVVALPTAAHVYPNGHGPGHGGTSVVEFDTHGDQIAEAILALLRPKIRTRFGGNVQAALGGARS